MVSGLTDGRRESIILQYFDIVHKSTAPYVCIKTMYGTVYVLTTGTHLHYIHRKSLFS